jgi:putative ribosome biogenesis GTPase RsgA
MAWHAGAEPIVALANADLGGAPTVEAPLADAALGVEVHTVSIRTGQGIEALAALARPARTLALVGESGAGKSSLATRSSAPRRWPRARFATATPRAATRPPPVTCSRCPAAAR